MKLTINNGVLISRAVNGLQIRRRGDVYCVYRLPHSMNDGPVFTTRFYARADEWRKQASLTAEEIRILEEA